MIAVVVLVFAAPAEPEFAGRPLSAWATQLKQDDTPRRRRAAALALTQIGSANPETLPVVLAALGTAARGDASPEVRRQAVAGVAQQRPDDSTAAVPDLTECLRSEKDAAVRLELVTALGRFGPAAAVAVAPLAECLGDVKLKLAAVTALGRIGPEAAPTAPRLIALLTDPDAAVKRATVGSLGRVKPAEPATVAAALLKVLPAADVALRREVLDTLARLGPPAGDVLTAVAGELVHADADVRVAAAQTLGRFGKDAGPAADKLLATFRTDAAPKVREAAARAVAAVWQAEPAKAVGPLAGQLAKDAAVEVRVAIADLLGGFGPAAAAANPELRRARSDPDPRVRHAASEALKRTEPKPD